VDSKAEYSALSSTRSQKKKLKQTTPYRGRISYSFGDTEAKWTEEDFIPYLPR